MGYFLIEYYFRKIFETKLIQFCLYRFRTIQTYIKGTNSIVDRSFLTVIVLNLLRHVRKTDSIGNWISVGNSLTHFKINILKGTNFAPNVTGFIPFILQFTVFRKILIVCKKKDILGKKRIGFCFYSFEKWQVNFIKKMY